VPSVAKRKQAGGSGAEIDNGEEESRQCIDAEMRAEPRQAKRQRYGRRNLPDIGHLKERAGKGNQGDHEARAIDNGDRPA
jgi:hypothetical protein